MSRLTPIAMAAWVLCMTCPMKMAWAQGAAAPARAQQTVPETSSEKAPDTAPAMVQEEPVTTTLRAITHTLPENVPPAPSPAIRGDASAKSKGRKRPCRGFFGSAAETAQSACPVRCVSV